MTEQTVPDLCGCGNPIRYIVANDPSRAACNKYARCPTYEEQAQLITKLKTELGKAIFCRHFVTSRLVESNASGNTSELDWDDRIKQWAELAGIDLSTMDPWNY